MPRVSKPKLYQSEIINAFDYQKTKENVLEYFSKYRLYSNNINLLLNTCSSSLSNDNLGIYSSKVTDKTSATAIKIIEYKEYIEEISKNFRKLRMYLTDDEKMIFNLSILSSHTDEELAEKLSLDKSNIYKRKKSCFIKVALFYNIDVLKWKKVKKWN